MLKNLTSLNFTILRNIRLSILLPNFLLLVLSFPAFSALSKGAISPSNVWNTFYRKIHFDTQTFDSSVPDFVVRQVAIAPNANSWTKTAATLSIPDKNSDFTATPVPPQFSAAENVLQKNNFMQCLKYQESLTQGIQSDVTVLSPFVLWNNSLSALSDHPDHLSTLKRKLRSSGLDAHGLFSGLVEHDGLPVSASAVIVTFMFSRYQLADEARLASNLARLSNSHNDTGTTYSLFSYEPNSPLDRLIFGLLVIAVCWYTKCSVQAFQGIVSNTGLIGTFLSQLFISVSVGASFVFYSFRDLRFFKVMFPIMVFGLTILMLDSFFRSVGQVQRINVFDAERFAASVAKSTTKGLLTTSSMVLGLSIRSAFLSDSLKKQGYMFIIVALVVSMILQIVYVPAILSVGMRRNAVADLVSSELKENKANTHAQPNTQPTTTRINNWRKEALKRKFPVFGSNRSAVFGALLLMSLTSSWVFEGIHFNILRILKANLHDTKPSIFIHSEPLLSEVLRRFSIKRGLIKIHKPVVLGAQAQSVTFGDLTNLNKAYKFDANSFFKFVGALIVLFALCLAYLNRILSDELVAQTSLDTKVNLATSFNTIDFVTGGHSLDVIKINSTRTSPFVVSIGMDHKVLVWSPMVRPVPKPFELPVPKSLWPVTQTIMSTRGEFIAVFFRNGTITCWSQLEKQWIWRVKIEELKNKKCLASFFHSMPKSFVKKTTESKSGKKIGRRYNTPRHMTNNNFEMPLEHNLRNETQFVVLLNSGNLILIDCANGAIRTKCISVKPLVSATLLIVPSDRNKLICSSVDGKIIVTSFGVEHEKKYVNFGPLHIRNEDCNASKKFVMNSTRPKADIEGPKNTGHTSMAKTSKPKIQRPEEFADSVLLSLDALGMIVRTRGLELDLIDVQTGTLINQFQIAQFKKSSLRVLYDQPTYCRFCGGVSIHSFSIAYTELETNMLMLHTFTVDNKAKKSICLRVGRDPRETRCLGFDSTVEHQHWLANVEVWEATDSNMIMGVLKRGAVSDDEDSTGSDGSFEVILNTEYQRPPASGGSRGRRNQMQNVSQPESWQGFIMGANGKVQVLDIPAERSPGLLAKRLLTCARYGHKAIIVPFSNWMKVLYLGNDELVIKDLEEKSTTFRNSGSSFASRRRSRVKR